MRSSYSGHAGAREEAADVREVLAFRRRLGLPRTERCRVLSPGDKARVDTDWGGVVLVTIGPPLTPEEGREIGGDGFHVTYEEGDREGTGGRHRRGALKPE